MIIKIIRHCKKWNKWRKRCGNGKLYKFLVLIKFTRSPTFMFMWDAEDYNNMREGFIDQFKKK